MKRISLVGALLLVCQEVFCQKRVDRDPSYSANNYKHPNKAAYAKAHNLDNSIVLSTVAVTEHLNYKQPFSKKVTSNKSVFVTKKVEKSTVSYKHPFGL